MGRGWAKGEGRGLKEGGINREGWGRKWRKRANRKGWCLEEGGAVEEGANRKG